MPPRTCQIVVEPTCWATITDSASLQAERETGGVLLGWRHSAGVYVCDAIEIPDRRAGRSQYVRRHGPASESLNRSLDTLPAPSPVGYVGEWHTHPAPHGPSRTDRKQLRGISRRLHDDIALIVASHDPRSGVWEPQGLCARAGRVEPAHIHITPAQPETPGADQ